MLLLHFYLLLLAFAMINFSFCYDYILDYDLDSLPVYDKFQKRSESSVDHHPRIAKKVKARNNPKSKSHSRHQKKNDDLLYLDVAKFLEPSEKYAESYDSRIITAKDLDSQFQKPSKDARITRKFERRLTRGNFHDDKEYHLIANRNQLAKMKIKPSHSKYLVSMNENSGALTLKSETKRDAPSRSFRKKKDRRFSIFKKSKQQDNNETKLNKNMQANKKIEDKNNKENLATANKDLKKSESNSPKESKPLKQVHVCPLCKREIDNLDNFQSESKEMDSDGRRLTTVKKRKVPNVRMVSSRSRRTKKRT